MTAGVPGTGIGGIFYLAAALLLPLRAIARHTRGRVAWRAVLQQAAIAAGVLLGLWLTGWLLGLVLGPALATSAAMRGFGSERVTTVLRWASLLAGLITLVVVLLSVQVARFLVRAPGKDGVR